MGGRAECVYAVSLSHSIHGVEVRAHLQQLFQQATVISEVLPEFILDGFRLMYRPFGLYTVCNAEGAQVRNVKFPPW
jgi:hypothetical protein